MVSNFSSQVAVMDGGQCARRSRFSLHFNTPRRRRWLLVQLVTIPAGTTHVEEEDDPEVRDTPLAQVHEAWPKTYLGLLDQYQTGQWINRTK